MHNIDKIVVLSQIYLLLKSQSKKCDEKDIEYLHKLSI